MNDYTVVDTREALRNALHSKPRTQAYVYVSKQLYDSLEAPVFADLQGPDVTLSRARSKTQYWVCYVVYDSGYETPDEFGSGGEPRPERMHCENGA